MPMLAVNSIAHLLVDAACVSAVFSCGGDLAARAAAYNALAFATQCFAGLLMDRFRGGFEKCSAAACAAVAAGALLPLPAALKIVLLGLGNSLFHVCAGGATLEASGGKAAPLGVFVAPGALGVAAGAAWPQTVRIAAPLLLLLCAAAYAARPGKTGIPERRARGDAPWGAAALLAAAVAVRAFGGSAAAYPWSAGAGAALLAAAVFAGKTAGGFVCDRLGAAKTAAISVPAAAVLAVLCRGWMAPALAGQFLLNLTMPVTLWLMYKAMPDSPAFAFGLAAAALWPGALAGAAAPGGARGALCAVISFMLGFAAIIAADKIIREEKT